jgi:hypothetical protein
MLSIPGKEPLPRATLHGSWETLAGEEILRRLADPAFDPAGALLLEEPAPPAPGREARGAASIERYDPDRVVVRASVEGDAFLLLADAWYPGWRVSVDGAPAKLYRADYAFRGVFLGPGEHVVDFRFEPRSFRVGAAVSCLSLGGTVLLLIKGHGRKRK